MDRLFPSSKPVFVLDTNILVEAHRRYYAMDLCPGFWKSMLHFTESGRIVSIDRVRQELRRQDDALTEWTRTTPDQLFRTTGIQEIADVYRELMDWVWQETRFRMQAKTDFAMAADGWVATYAKVYRGVVVTHERRSPQAKRRVPLPDLCDRFRIPCKDTFEMLRELGVVFEWPGAA